MATVKKNKPDIGSANILSNGDERPVGLYPKIAYVMGQVQHVPKNGYNEHFKYAYVREVDLTEHLRPLLAELGLIILPNATDKIQLAGEGSKTVTSIRFEFMFVDAETGDSITIGAWGAGQDGQDKGPYKALTGALKYVLMKTFLVPTGDDPEATDGDGNPTDRHYVPTDDERGRERTSTQRAPRQPAPQRQAESPPAQDEPRKRTTAAPVQDDETVALLEEQIGVTQEAIKDYISTITEDKDVTLEDDEENNKKAAAQLIANNKMPDRARYLKALNAAQEYLENLLRKYGYEIEE